MLYKNDEVYSLATRPDEIKKLKAQFHNKFPVKIIYPPERIQKSRLPHNRLPDKPNSITFKYKAIVKTPTGTEVWRYAESMVVNERGMRQYQPPHFTFSGATFLNENDIEKIYFLFRKCEHCLGGDNYKGSKPKFMFEDLFTEAEKRVEKKALESQLDVLLYHKKFAMDEGKLRDVAMALDIVVTDRSFAQVKNAIADKVHGMKDGFERFFSMIDAPEEIKTRASIHKVIEQGILVFHEKDRLWQWKTPTGIEKVAGGKVSPNKTPMEALYDLYQGDQSFRDDMQVVLLTNNPKAGKTKEKVEATE
jgi:hypothetical protein